MLVFEPHAQRGRRGLAGRTGRMAPVSSRLRVTVRSDATSKLGQHLVQIYIEKGSNDQEQRTNRHIQLLF